MQKRGLTQADWIISLGIFLLYLAWFFVIIKPALAPDRSSPLLIDDLKEEFMEDVSWQLMKTPVFIHGEIEGFNEPVIVHLPTDINEKNAYIKDTYFTIDDSRLLFLTDIEENSKIVNIIHSEENYSQEYRSTDLQATKDGVSVRMFDIEMNDSMIEEVSFRDSTKIRSFSFYAGGTRLRTNVNEFNSTDISAKYKVITPKLKHTMYVLAYNQRIYSFINTEENTSVSLYYDLDHYDNYDLEKKTGQIPVNSSDCVEFESNYLDLFDEDYGVIFIFDRRVEGELCFNNTIDLEVTFDVKGESLYQVVFYNKMINSKDYIQPYTAEVGITDKINGLSSEKLSDLEKRNYTDIKKDWSYEYDFDITVTSNKTSFDKGTEPYQMANIYSEQFNAWLVDKYGEYEEARVNILGWK